MQKSGKIKLPEGKKVAVNISCDFDAQCVWADFDMLTPVFLSRGEFGAEVGAPRLLSLFKKYQVKSTWFIPGHTADTFPEICKEVIAAGHEVGVHNYAHENPRLLNYDEEKSVIGKSLEALTRIGADRPKSYRSPAFDYSENTLKILEEFGFCYDSSLMGNDLHPYYPRPVTHHTDRANEFGLPSPILEFPVSWVMDDFPQVEYVEGVIEGMRPLSGIYEYWTSIFDYACQLEGCCYVLALHPQVSGRSYMIQLLERLIKYMTERGAWFTSISEAGANFIPD